MVVLLAPQVKTGVFNVRDTALDFQRKWTDETEPHLIKDTDWYPGLLKRLDPEWRELFERWPDRFMIGTDTYTPERWYFVSEHATWSRQWMADLPDDLVRDLVLMKLNAVGLRGARDLMPSQLSGGMARRVALAAPRLSCSDCWCSRASTRRLQLLQY